MNASTASPVATQSPQPAPILGSGGSTPATPAVTLPGSGIGTTAEGAIALGTVRSTGRDSGVTVPLDQFSKRAGPDAAVKTDDGLVRVHAVFSVDPTTKEMRVSVVDESGRLIRMIPPDSVAKMIAAMATYRGR